MSSTQETSTSPRPTPLADNIPVSTAPVKKARVKRTNPLTARRFFDPVVLALGEMTDFKVGVPVPMKDVQDKVLESFEFTADDRLEVEATNKNGDEPASFLSKFARRRIQFAFRNRRNNSSFNNSRNQSGAPTVYLKNGTALTDSLGVGQWGLTEAGVAKALELSALENEPTETPEIEPAPAPTGPEGPEISTPEPVQAATSEDQTEAAEGPPEVPEKTIPVVTRRRTLGSYTS